MSQPECNVWFGPGGVRGVFGAGVAEGLSGFLDRGELDGRRLRLFGSSIGCLNAVFLATGNAGCGLSIFQEDTKQLLRFDNLLPSLLVRVRNRVRTMRRDTIDPLPVPAVLDVDHVFRVMDRRTPDIVQQIRQSPIAVYSEVVELPDGRYQHLNLCQADEPLEGIRSALHCFPFYCHPGNPQLLDSGVHGPGFIDLLERYAEDRLVVVLNAPLGQYWLRHLAADVVTAMLAASPRISAFYLGKQLRLHSACRHVRDQARRVLLVFPEGLESLGGADAIRRLHAQGVRAAEHIVRFIGLDSAADSGPRTIHGRPRS